MVDKGNNKITELRTIFQRESKNSQVYKQTKSVNNRKTVIKNMKACFNIRIIHDIIYDICNLRHTEVVICMLLVLLKKAGVINHFLNFV